MRLNACQDKSRPPELFFFAPSTVQIQFGFSFLHSLYITQTRKHIHTHTHTITHTHQNTHTLSHTHKHALADKKVGGGQKVKKKSFAEKLDAKVVSYLAPQKMT